MTRKRFLAVVIFPFSVIMAFVSFYFYQIAYTPNFQADKGDQDVYIYIQKGWDFQRLLKYLDENRVVHEPLSFAFVAQLKGYQDQVKPGKYLIKANTTNPQVVNALRMGQVPVQLTFNNVWKKSELTDAIFSNNDLSASASEFERLLSDTAFLDSLGFDSISIFSMFLPDTYEIYWTYSARDIFERMKEEYTKYWNDSRRAKAESLNLKPKEVVTLASIVQKESNAGKERATIAGLYLNRLQKGWPLQADPTVVFAHDTSGMKRVLNEHLEIDSPYNTYKNKGLPPGPIYMPDKGAIEAVLNAEEHEYMYMCAKGDGSGLHNFAKTSYQHAINREIYARNLRKRNKR